MFGVHGASLLLFCCPFLYHTVSEVGLVHPCTLSILWVFAQVCPLNPGGVSVLYSVALEVAFDISVGGAKVCDTEEHNTNKESR